MQACDTRRGAVIAHRGRRWRARATRGDAGHALLTTLIATACLLPLGAFAAMQARLDHLVQQYTRTAQQTFAVAESGLEHALADLAADARFDRLLSGPDHRLGTADDGQFPFRQAPPSFFPAEPFRYEVRVAAVSADRADITARGFGPRGAVRTVVATVIREPLPAIPAALALAAPDVAVLLGTGLDVIGMDRSGTAAALPALTLNDAAAAAALAAHLPAESAPHVVGAGGSPSIAGAAVADLAAIAAAAAQRSEAVRLGGDALGALGDGLFVAPGSLRLADATGSGVLVVGGNLEIVGSTSFSGLIIAAGDLRLDAGSTATVDGAVLSGGLTVCLRGAGHIAYDARAVARSDAAHPGLLPRRARVTGWREEPDAGL